MHKIIVLLFLMPHLTTACPTCIGLPRLNERPFFERKSFLAALEQPKAQQQQPQNPKKTEPDSTHKK